MKRLTQRRIALAAALIFALLLILLIAGAMRAAPAPGIQTSFGGASVDIQSDSAWALPFGCVEIRWNLEGIQSLHIDGGGRIGWGQAPFCPSLLSTDSQIRVVAQDGGIRDFTLDFRYLLTELLAAALLAALPALVFLALWILRFHNIDARPRIPLWMPLLYVLAILLTLFAAVSDALSIPQIVAAIANIFVQPGWHYAGMIPCFIVFAPLAWDAARRGLKSGARRDTAAVAALAGLVVLLYLEFGLDTMPEWEGWDDKLFLEGGINYVRNEFHTRFWRAVYSAYANTLDPYSYVGLRFVNGCMFWAKLTLFYGILRQLKVSPFFAFLCAALYMAYPVNPRLMSLRQANMNFNELNMFAAAYLALHCLSAPSRLKLAGMWLALLFVFGTYEAGYVLVAFAPLLWLVGSCESVGRRLNVTWYWYGAIGFVCVWLLLTATVGLNTRSDGLSDVMLTSGKPTLEIIAHYAELIVRYYRQTFLLGWQEALAALPQNQWLFTTIAALILVGAVGAWLSRQDRDIAFPPRRRIAAYFGCGLIYVLLSVGFFIWFEAHNRGEWRIYVMTAAGGAIALFGLLLALSSVVKRNSWRNGLLIALCLALLLPALSRLHVQQDFFLGRVQNHRIVLSGIVRAAPAFDAEARALLIADMDFGWLKDEQIYPFRSTLHRVSQVLYQQRQPELFDLCWDGGRGCKNGGSVADAIAPNDPSQFVLFRLREDLSVELLHEMPLDLNIPNAEAYNPNALIDFDAPLPPRAISMLGMSRP